MARSICSPDHTILRDDFDHRRVWIGLGDDIDNVKRVLAAEQERDPGQTNHQPLRQGKSSQPFNHRQLPSVPNPGYTRSQQARSHSGPLPHMKLAATDETIARIRDRYDR